MKRIISSLTLLLLLGLVSARAADDTVLETPYYPLKVGSKWTYKVGGSAFTIEVAKHEKVGDVMCALLETSKDGQVVTSEHVGVKTDGVYRYTISGQKPDAPFRILKLPAKKGESWKVEAKIAGQGFNGSFTAGDADITTPAGKFKTVTAFSDGFEVPDPNGGTLKITFKFWFAEKVGLVKQTIGVGDRPEVVIELEKYEAK